MANLDAIYDEVNPKNVDLDKLYDEVSPVKDKSSSLLATGAAVIGGGTAVAGLAYHYGKKGYDKYLSNSPANTARRAQPSIDAAGELIDKEAQLYKPAKDVIAGPEGQNRVNPRALQTALSSVPETERASLLQKHASPLVDNNGSHIYTNEAAYNIRKDLLAPGKAYDYYGPAAEVQRVLKENIQDPKFHKALADTADFKEMTKPLAKATFDKGEAKSSTNNIKSLRLQAILKANDPNVRNQLYQATEKYGLSKNQALMKTLDGRNMQRSIGQIAKGGLRVGTLMSIGKGLFGGFKSIANPINYAQMALPLVETAVNFTASKGDEKVFNFLEAGGNVKAVPKEGTPARRVWNETVYPNAMKQATDERQKLFDRQNMI